MRLMGIACMVAGSAVFASVDAVVKWLMADYSVVQVMFFRSAFALLPLAPLVWRAGAASLATRRPVAHALRAGLGLVAIGSFFIAFRELPLAQVIAISFAASLIMTALSVPILGETVGPRRWAAVAVGFVGVLVIVRPGGAELGLGMVAALLGTVLYAVVMVLMREMARTEKSVTIVFWFTLTCTLLTGAALPWHWQPPSWPDLGLFALLGVLGGSGQLLATQAVRLAPVSVVAPFDYLHIIWSVALGWALWAEVPTLHTVAGAAVIIGCGLYILEREARARD